ncbi:protein phosphatase 1 regulatory subunit 3A isoform X1 [Embiotoca jacksoni]|uniref:protein phosphatase 1 regulatory subunit 3A isoform X1 n=1 Tax=Embiotoca jacksoni TaxID=100190 RepID=UPI003703DA35
MEFVGQPRTSGACNLLGVPGVSSVDVDDDEFEVVSGIRPKSSPLPRRRSSTSDEDSDPEPPLCGSRRVSFADAKGLSLVQVKEFDTCDVPKLPGYDSSEGEGKNTEEYFLSPHTFLLPLSTEELSARVQEQKLELETIELLPGTTTLKGLIRVLNISFNKAVYIRTTLDSWSTHFDLLAEYIPGSSDGLMDCFSFKLTLVPPFGEQGARVDFCLRYETPVGTFWANNNNRNYVLFCHHKMKEGREKPQTENVNKKSCLKTVSQNFSTVENISATEASSQENISTDVSNHGPGVDTMEAKKISDGQSGTSGEQSQKLLDNCCVGKLTLISLDGQMESRQKSVRKSRRKAARMARVKNYFTQRDGAANDTQRDEQPPGIKEAAQQETPEEKHTDVQSFSEDNRKSEGSQLVSDSPETFSEALLNVQHDTSSAHDYTTISETEKSENTTLAESATLTGGERATDVPDNTLHSNDEASSADEHVNMFVTKAEESSQTNNTAAVSCESQVSPTNNFTFGTVVAPLYHQVFGRAGSESQSVGDRGNPAWAPLGVGGLNPHSDRRQFSCIVPTGHKSQVNVINNQESNYESLDATLNCPTEEEETSLSVTVNDVLDCADTLQEPAETEYSDQICKHRSADSNPLLAKEEPKHSGEIKVIGEVSDSMTEVMMTKYHEHEDMFVELKDEDTREMESAISKQDEDFCSADITEMKNWEMMVEEEENNIYTSKEDSEAIHLKAEDTKAVEKDTTEKKVEEFVEEVTGTEVKEVKADNTGGLEDEESIREEETGNDSGDVETEVEYVQVTKTDETAGEEEDAEAEKTEGPEEKQKEKHFTEKQEVNIKRKNVQEEEKEEEEKMEIDLNDEGEAGEEEEDQVKLKEENGEEKNPDYKKEILNEAGEAEIVDADSCMAIEDREDEEGCSEERSDITHNKAEDGLSALVNNGQEDVSVKVIEKENTGGGQKACNHTEICLYNLEGFQSNKSVTHERSKAENESSAAEGDILITDEPENDQTSHNSTSEESDSDNEVELYMHCLRAVGTAAQARRDRNKDTSCSGSRRLSVSRNKLPSTPMPSISESLDEEQHLSRLQENHEDERTAAVVAVSASSGQEGIKQNVLWWKDTFSCKNISKTLFCTTSLVVFAAVAYHYDFLACFGLYLISVVWLCCQGERQPVKNNKRIG